MMREHRPVVTVTKYLIFNKMEHSRCLKTARAQSLTGSRNSSPFMKRGNLLPCSQESATAPYPEPDESKLHPHILFI
jgi:hypothetical protein